MSVLISVILPLALAIIMFSLGLGLTLDDFRRVLSRPVAFLTGALCQVVLLPAVAFSLVLLFALPPELAVGFMILSFCPGGVTSNLMSKLARGDVALSVSLTAVISLLSMLTVPFLVAATASYFLGSTAPPVSVAGLAFAMFAITTLPVLIGVTARQTLPDLTSRMEPVVSRLAVALFAIIVIAALASNWATFVDNVGLLGPSLITLNIVLIFVGALVARLIGLTRPEAVAVSLETGIQNSTLGITLGTLIAVQATGFTAFSLPSAVYGITMYLVALPAILWFRKD